MTQLANKTIVAVALLLFSPSAAAAVVACQYSKPPGVYAAWREVAGRRCWYIGRHRLSKSALYWPAAEPHQQTQTLPAPAIPMPVAPTPAVPLPPNATPFRERWPR